MPVQGVLIFQTPAIQNCLGPHYSPAQTSSYLTVLHASPRFPTREWSGSDTGG